MSESSRDKPPRGAFREKPGLKTSRHIRSALSLETRRSVNAPSASFCGFRGTYLKIGGVLPYLQCKVRQRCDDADGTQKLDNGSDSIPVYDVKLAAIVGLFNRGHEAISSETSFGCTWCKDTIRRENATRISIHAHNDRFRAGPDSPRCALLIWTDDSAAWARDYREAQVSLLTTGEKIGLRVDNPL
jgi:hypothetical protein